MISSIKLWTLNNPSLLTGLFVLRYGDTITNFIMASIDELRNERLRKLNLIKEAGLDPYPSTTRRDHTITDVFNAFDELSDKSTVITIAGRVMALRGSGALVFGNVQDGGGNIQILLKKDEMDEEKRSLFIDVSDVGDFVEFTGTVFTTNRGEKTLQVSDWGMLSKSLRPLPDKRHGIADEELRYRDRHLDILMDAELRALLERKAKFWRVVRDFMIEKNFAEVETPTLEVTTGGAEARPFKTHHNDFDIDVYLRISVGELWQKRLMSAGYEKTFEIGRIYRNEGTSPNHLQEFTNMEFYWGYADYRDGMQLVQELYRKIALEVFGTTQFVYGEMTFDLADKWTEIDYQKEIEKQTGINIHEASEEDLQNKLTELSVKYEGQNRERMLDSLWKYCRKNIEGPAFLVNHPKLVSPLAKTVVGNKSLTQRFQPLIAGVEVGNGYSELNNPIEQRERFEVQQGLLEGGDDEAMMPDWEFVEMLEHGMPPTCGFGFGERLFAILSNKTARECQTFPLMRPKE